MGKTEKKRKENHTNKVNKIQNTKIWDERNTSRQLISSLIQTLDARQIELLEKAAMLGARPKQ